jgi:hypothetical protein
VRESLASVSNTPRSNSPVSQNRLGMPSSPSISKGFYSTTHRKYYFLRYILNFLKYCDQTTVPVKLDSISKQFQGDRDESRKEDFSDGARIESAILSDLDYKKEGNVENVSPNSIPVKRQDDDDEELLQESSWSDRAKESVFSGII